MKENLALLLVPVYLKENRAKFYAKEAHDISGAYIHCRGSSIGAATKFVICVEQQEVCETQSLARAFLLLLGSYYIFDLCYIKGTTSTLNFLQIILCDIGNDQARVKDTKLLGFLSKLNKM